MEYLNGELSAADNYQPDVTYFQRQWQNMTVAPDNALTFWDTGLDYGLLHYIGQQSVAYPEEFVSIMCPLSIPLLFICDFILNICFSFRIFILISRKLMQKHVAKSCKKASASNGPQQRHWPSEV